MMCHSTSTEYLLIIEVALGSVPSPELESLAAGTEYTMQ